MFNPRSWHFSTTDVAKEVHTEGFFCMVYEEHSDAMRGMWAAQCPMSLARNRRSSDD